MPLTSLWLLSAFGVTKDSSASSFFISPPGGDRPGFFWQLRGRCTLLDFKFKFQEFNDKTNSQVQVFLMLVTGQKLLASEQIKYSAFSRTFLVLGNRTRDSSAQKIQWNNHKGKSKYLFIYLLFFLGMAFLLFFYNSKLGPHLLPLRVPHRHIRFLPFSRILKYGPRDPLSYRVQVLTPIKHTRAMLINFFRIFRKPQVGELDQGWS